MFCLWSVSINLSIFLFDLPRGPVLCCNCLTFEDWYVRTILTKTLGRKRRSGQCCLAKRVDLGEWQAFSSNIDTISP